MGYHVENYERYELVLGKQINRNGSPAAEKSEIIEGKHYRILYGLEEDRSPLEVIRNYQEALEIANFEKLYSCSTDECGNQRLFSNRLIYKQGTTLGDKGLISSKAFVAPSNLYFAVYKGSRDGLDIYVVLMSANSGLNSYDMDGKTVLLLDVIETTPMDKGQISAEEVEKGMDKSGFARFYHILFDFDSDVIKEGSEFELDVMADYIRNHPDQELYIVGHTDNVGSLKFNLDLSERRAKAVLTELIEKYGISSQNLTAKGVGSLAPVTNNKNDLGRAKNRRVELVVK